MKTTLIYRTAIISTFVNSRHLRKCSICMLIVNESGGPDSTYYTKEEVAHFEAIPEAERCHHVLKTKTETKTETTAI